MLLTLEVAVINMRVLEQDNNIGQVESFSYNSILNI